MATLEVEAEAAARGAKATQRNKEEQLVELDLWKLEVRRIRGLLAR